MTENNGNGRTWNRRFRAWNRFGVFFVLMTFLCFYFNRLDFYEVFARWSIIGLVALIGGLSWTDAMFNRKP